MSVKLLNERVGEEVAENIFNQNYPSADTFAVTLRAGQGIVARGTVLAKSSGTAGKSDMVVLGTAAATDETLTANCILADPVDTGGTGGAAAVGIAYRIGHFNGNRLLVKTGYSLTASDKENLRIMGILLSDAAEF